MPDALPSRGDGDDVAALVRAACVGRGSFAELGDPAALVLSALPPAAQQALRAAAPERITLASGRSVPVHYDAGDTPWIESRLQDFFGTRAVPALGAGARRADGAPAGAERARRAGDARSRELLDAALPGAAPPAEPALSRSTPGPRTAPPPSHRPLSRRATTEELGGETYTDGAHAAVLAAALAQPRRARSAARAAGRAPRQPPGADRRGPPAPAQLRREPLPVSARAATSSTCSGCRCGARSRSTTARRSRSTCPTPRPTRRCGKARRPAADEISEATGCPVRPLARLPASVRGRAVATLPAPDVETCLEQSRLLGRDIRRGVIDVLDAPLADAIIELRLHHDDAARAELRLAAAATAAAHAAGMRATRPGRTRRARCARRWRPRSWRAAWAAPIRRSSRRTARSCTASATTCGSPTAICCSPTSAPRRRAAGRATSRAPGPRPGATRPRSARSTRSCSPRRSRRSPR